MSIQISYSTLIELIAGSAALAAGVVYYYSQSTAQVVESKSKSKSKSKKKTAQKSVEAEAEKITLKPKVEDKSVIESKVEKSVSIDSTPVVSVPKSAKKAKKVKLDLNPSIPIAVVPSIPTNSNISFANIVGSPSKSTTTSQKPTNTIKHPTTITEKVDTPIRDDEIESEDRVARVMKIENKRKGEEEEWKRWEQSEQATEEEGAWEVPKSKKPTTFAKVSTASSAFATSNPPPQQRSIPGLGAVTKKQKENSKKSQKKGDEKEALEAERLDRLRAHRAVLERTRMMEQDRERAKARPKAGAKVTEPARKSIQKQSGGMHASLDGDGKLIWE